MKKFLLIFFMLTSTSLAAAPHYEKAILAGGCFWGMQELLRGVNGVVETRVGYSGGDVANPNYEIVSSGLSGHAEVVEVTFDSRKISYENLLKFFFTIHDPTTRNRQENDIGAQYRSVIFYFNDKQKNTALKVIAAANKSGVFKKPLVTEVAKAKVFYPAEEIHQNYLQKNPYGYTCHHVREEWKF